MALWFENDLPKSLANSVSGDDNVPYSLCVFQLALVTGK